VRNEKLFSDTMIESMPGILYFCDAQGRFLRWNRNFETVSGYSGEEIARMHPRDFFSDEDKPRVEQRIAEVFGNGESSVEAVFVAKDGTAVPYFFRGRHVLFEGNSCLVGVGIDISDRRRAEDRLAESEQKYRELVEHANSIILRWNSEGRITFLNEFGQRFFGYTAEEIIGRHVIGTIVPHTESGGRDLGRLMEDILDAPEPFEQNVNENMRRNGERVWIAWTNRIVRDARGRVVELLSIGTDITERRRAATALREAELRFHTLFEQTPVGVVVVDPATASIIECNEQAARQLGYAPNEFSGLGFADIESMETRQDALRRIEGLLTEGRAEFETRHRTRSGEIRDVLVSGQVIELAGRKVIQCVFLDITERKRAEAKIRESEAHLVEAQRIAKIGSWEFDIRNNRLKWSDQIYEIFGIPKSIAASTAEAFFAVVHPSDRDRLQAAQQAALAGQARLDIEHRIVLRDGSEKVVHELADLKRDETGRPIVLAGTLHDITDRRRIEAEREKRERAEAADRIKSAFLATMSHELRTPLNSIIGFTGIVLQGLAGPLNPEQTKQLGMVRASARHLLELINDVLDISKIEAGQLEVRAEPFDLPALIERATASVKPLAEKKGLALTTNIPPELQEMVSDRRRVEQILLNLLNNALKFTDQGGVTLTVEMVAGFQPSLEAPPRPAVRMRVADTGIGIKPEDLALLFQPFRQVDTGLTRQHDGTGLGLAICRRLAELLGGEISASSEWQHGSEFTVVLPLQKAI
jgi:PAS domain S-box-containing protein